MKFFASESNKKVVIDKTGATRKSSFATNKHSRESGKNGITKSTEAAVSSKDNKESRNDDDNYDPHSVYLMSLFGGNNADDDDGTVRCSGVESRSPRSSMKELEKALDVPYFWH
jgi:hypothetical protein